MENETQDATDYSLSCTEITSPSQLQEVTLDADATSLGYSLGLNSAGRGRSVKEFEEQLIHLRKENFNLKLRIYFLEERMGANFNLDKDSAVKKNVELMVEVESLRKELDEKQDLLCQAVKAMELEEEEHKKELRLKDEQLLQFQEQLDDLQFKLQDTKTEMEVASQKTLASKSIDNRSFQKLDMEDNNYSEYIKDLEDKINILEEELARERENSATLENLARINSSVDIRCKNLEEESQQKDEKISKLHKELHDFARKFSNCNLRIQALEDELMNRNSELQHRMELLKQKEEETKETVVEMESLRNSLMDANSLYKEEEHKVEKLRAAVMMRNSKLMELEKTTELQKAKIRTLETRLESLQNEVKRKTDELETIKSPVHRKKTTLNTDTDSFSVPNASRVSQKSAEKSSTLNVSAASPNSPSKSSKSPPRRREAGEDYDPNSLMEEVKKYREELSAQEQKILKLKSDQFKACQIIKSMINSRGDMEKEVGVLKKKVEALQLENGQLKRAETPAEVKKTKSLHETISEMKFTVAGSPDAEKEKPMDDSTVEVSQLAEKYKQLTVELENQIEVLVATLKEKDSQMFHLREDYEILAQQLKAKENHIVDLEFELLAGNKSNASVNAEKADEGNEKRAEFWVKEIEEKDREIERLENELRKRTCDLQGIVNKELWEKNKEIEKLQQRYVVVLDKKEQEISKLQKNLAGKELQLDVLKDKISELGIHVDIPCDLFDNVENINLPNDVLILQEQLKLCLNERKFFLTQVEELKVKSKLETELRQELEKSEKLRTESYEICSVLSARLQELAQFLQSLLQEKSVLGFLGYKRNNKLKQIVTQSLDLSRTLSMSISQNPDQSLMQLTDISNLLNATNADNSSISECFKENEDDSILSIIPSNITLTYQSHLQRSTSRLEATSGEQTEIIKVLRQQVENLKREVELRDIELNKFTTNEESVRNDQELVEFLVDIDATRPKVQPKEKIMEELMADKSKTSSTLKYRTENQSESESWSEPDRTVSQARIGLDDDSLKPSSNTSLRRNRFTTGLSTESTEEESIGLTRTPSKKTVLAENRQTIISLHEQLNDLQTKLAEKDNELIKSQLAFYENDNIVKTEKICNAETKKELERVREEAEKYRVEAENKLRELREQYELLKERTQQKDKELVNRINELEVEKEKAIEAVKRADEEVKASELKANNIQKECDDKLIKAQKELADEIENIRRGADAEIHKANAVFKEMQETYEKEYIKRSEVDRRILEVEILVAELENLKDILKMAEQNMQSMEMEELDLKQKLREQEKEHNERVNKLHKDLDTATLQYSEAVLEKTKLANEKTALEQKLKANDHKELLLQKQVGEFQRELAEVKEGVHKKMVSVENHRTKLQMRVTQLESLNTELRSKLAKLQTGRGDQCLSTSLPTSPNRLYETCNNIPLHHMQPYLRQNSDNSGYTSEDLDNRRGINFHRGLAPIVNVDVERQEANSSPDLGIESDQGRFSSLEANVHRPMLMTLELTESMSNLLDGDGNNIQELKCSNENCSKKIQEMICENNDLKKHLLRTRRALEETMTRLAISNQRKVQVEKTICKQIHKTSQVLRKAKANLDSGSETDICRK